MDNYIPENCVFTPKILRLAAVVHSAPQMHVNHSSQFNAIPRYIQVHECLKDIPLNSCIKIRSADLPFYRKRVNYISTLIELYRNKNISRFDFVKNVCYQYVKK